MAGGVSQWKVALEKTTSLHFLFVILEWRGAAPIIFRVMIMDDDKMHVVVVASFWGGGWLRLLHE